VAVSGPHFEEEIAAMPIFKHLFEPIRIGSMEVPNRICHEPTDISSSHKDGSVSDRDIYHHTEIAKGGTGLVIVGATSPNARTNRSTVTNLVADDDSYIPGLARMAASMHRYGAKCAVQLQHAGRQASLPRDGKIASNDVAMNLPWSQSHAIVYANADEKVRTVKVLTTDEVIQIVEEFSEAAWRVMQAGFDCVELHAAHGYLVSQFMSPYLNKRTDRFGGSFDNRMRFPLAIVQSIQNKCGRDFPVIIRYSADEWVPGGREIVESVEVAKVFERAGVAALDLSQCIQESPGAGFDPMQYPEGWTMYASEAVKKAVKIPVINSHSLRNPEYCEKVLAEGKTDMVGLSRQILADPYWPLKAKYGKVRAIRRCISCLTGCWQESMMAKKEIMCAINPACGNEALAITKKTDKPLKAAVVGGGPAGMEAARAATERGHTVTLFEKTWELGGAILGCCMAPGKDEKMKWYADWLRYQMEDLKVDVRLCAAPSVKDLKAYDVVVNATGARSYVPEVHGLSEKVVPFEEAIACPKVTCEFHPANANKAEKHERKPWKLEGTKVIVWGDHYAAVDTATYLASIGKEVTIVTDRKEFASSVEVIHMYVTWKRFRQTEAEALTSKPYKHPVTVHQGCMIDEIREREVVLVDRDFNKITVPYDSIVTCWTRPDTALLELMKAAGLPVINVGDSVAPRNLHAAVREGSTAALTLEEALIFNPNGAVVNELPIDLVGQLTR
jgi:2,4-dienoyl-CoA reductase-like NADH-dependent reductase (Old Yellow Enzyme family)/thioredoxin reductase